MENAEWRVGKGEWGMENGEGRMGKGEWGRENGEWRMGNEKWEKWELIFNFFGLGLLFIIRNRYFSLISTFSFKNVQGQN